MTDKTTGRGLSTFFKSYFLLPFKLEGKPSQPMGGWRQRPTTMADILQNEQNKRLLAEHLYFHPHVRRFLYDLKGFDEGLQYYELPNAKGSIDIQYRVGENAPERGIEATIPANGLSCYRFYNDVCVLAIETLGRMPTADVLDFNNLARRLFSGFGDVELQRDLGEFPTSLQVSMKIDGHEPLEVKTDFRQPESGGLPSPSGVVIEPRELFSQRTFHPAVRQLLDRLFPGSGIKLLLDDRLLLLSRIAIDGQPPAIPVDDPQHEIIRSRGMWVDKGNLNTKEYDKRFLDDLEPKFSNHRWSHFGGEMGFSRYSAFFMGYDHGLTADDRGLITGIEGKPAYLFDHLDTMYLKMFLMAAFYRATLLQLSGQVAELITNKSSTGNGTRRERLKLAKDIKRTLHEVVHFSNRYWFTELTNQDQGIEIFDLMRKAFRLDEMFEALKSDVQRTDTFLDSLLAIDELESNRTISRWGLFFGTFAVLTGFFGMNVFGDDKAYIFSAWGWFPWILAGVIVLIGCIMICHGRMNGDGANGQGK